jgi:hypothetical protein
MRVKANKTRLVTSNSGPQDQVSGALQCGISRRLMTAVGQTLPSHSALVRINVRFPTASDRLSEITKASLRADSVEKLTG